MFEPVTMEPGKPVASALESEQMIDQGTDSVRAAEGLPGWDTGESE
jgi:hypothetical protein